MSTYRIYSLQDPETGETRYVGITRQTLKARLTSHLSEARRRIGTSYRENWIRSLQSRKLVPVITLLEETDNPEREGHWITHYRERGARLVNGLALCEGLNEHDEETRQKIAEASRRMWADPEKRRELGEKISKATKGRKLSEEHCRKIGESKKGNKFCLGYKHSEQSKRKNSESKKGKPGNKKTPAQLEAHLKMCRDRSADPEYREKLAKAQVSRYENPEQLDAHREMCRRRSADPKYREKLKEAWKSRPRPTHCKHGHSLEDAYIRPNGRRSCKRCSAIRCKEYQKRQRTNGKN